MWDHYFPFPNEANENENKFLLHSWSINAVFMLHELLDKKKDCMACTVVYVYMLISSNYQVQASEWTMDFDYSIESIPIY